MAIVQVTIVLREKLEEIGVEVSVETFEESQGIAGLGDDPFVSCTMVHVVRLVVLATHFVRVNDPKYYDKENISSNKKEIERQEQGIK